MTDRANSAPSRGTPRADPAALIPPVIPAIIGVQDQGVLKLPFQPNLNVIGPGVSVAVNIPLQRFDITFVPAIFRVQGQGILMPYEPIIDFEGDGVSLGDDAPGTRTGVRIPGVFKSKSIIADYTIASPFHVVFVAGALPPAVPGPARTIKLPAGGVLDDEYTVKDVTGTASAATPIVVDGNGALIDGVGTRQITVAYGSVHMKFDGAAWRVL